MADGPKRPPTLQTPTDRELASASRARRDRATPPSGVDAIPAEFEGEAITGNYEGEDLQRARQRRGTGERLDRLEVKHDQLVKDVTETRVLVGEMRGELKVLPELVSVIKAGAQRDHVTFTAKVDVDKKREEAQIELEKTEALTELEIAQAKQLADIAIDQAKKKDELRARNERRKRVTKIVGLVVGTPAAWELLKWIAGQLR